MLPTHQKSLTRHPPEHYKNHRSTWCWLLPSCIAAQNTWLATETYYIILSFALPPWLILFYKQFLFWGQIEQIGTSQHMPETRSEMHCTLPFSLTWPTTRQVVPCAASVSWIFDIRPSKVSSLLLQVISGPTKIPSTWDSSNASAPCDMALAARRARCSEAENASSSTGGCGMFLTGRRNVAIATNELNSPSISIDARRLSSCRSQTDWIPNDPGFVRCNWKPSAFARYTVNR